jgi:uncharacterized membrane protein YdbT with pleckstrin-like domain
MAMPEQTVWRGTSSQWKNIGTFIAWGIAALLLIFFSLIVSRSGNAGIARLGPLLLILAIVPIGFAAAHYLITRAKVFELTNERLKITQGIFSKATDTLELYRVKDIETRQPFWYRMGGVENVQLNTSDTSSPLILIDAIPCSVGLGDQVRNQVEAIRQQKGVREIDVE